MRKNIIDLKKNLEMQRFQGHTAHKNQYQELYNIIDHENH